nr:hypothetical protein [Tanacetum cinerariifolium]
MSPKRTTTLMTHATIKQLIAQRVANALAEYKANRNSRNGEDNHGSGSVGRRQVPTTRECTYNDFLKCQPLNFKGNEGVIGLNQWFEKMESVFHISNCIITCQIKFATCTLFGSALTLWNSYVKTVGHDVAYGMAWKTLKKMMTTRMFPDESNKAKKYVDGPPDMIQVENKRKLDNDNQAQQQPPKKQNVAMAYFAGSSKKKEYAGTLPLCNKCKFHYNGPCTVKCANSKRVGHLTRDCRSPAASNNQRTLTCYGCGNQGHYRSDCS